VGTPYSPVWFISLKVGAVFIEGILIIPITDFRQRPEVVHGNKPW
jgi:hypothetical protein